MVRITLSTPDDLASPAGQTRLGTRWRALEAQADASFFQSWSWVGSRIAERFPDPVLLEAIEGDDTVALALFNRAGGLGGDTLWLNETGHATWDTPYVEFNGPLIRRDRTDLAATCLAAALRLPIGPRRGWGRRLVLSGINATLAAVAEDLAGHTLARQPAKVSPWVDLAAIRAAGRGFADTVSSNTRYQLRRSVRRYTEVGPIVVTPAQDTAQAFAFLDALATLHQESWTRRGQPGAFSLPFFRDFHRDVIAAAHPRGEIDLLRITAGIETIGYLYNFHFNGVVMAYQSGFAYRPGDNQRKPGLTCHALAIEAALTDGLAAYHFLAGEDRYKTSLGNAAQELHWLELGPPWRPAALWARLVGR